MAIAFVTAGINTTGAAATSLVITTDAATGTGNTIVVNVGIRTTTAEVASITGGGTYRMMAAINNGTVARSEIWAIDAGTSTSVTSITVNVSASTRFETAAASYSGVSALGSTFRTTGTTANPSINLTTQDANNWVVASFDGQGTNIATAGTGNLRKAGATGGTASTGTTGALNDNTAASAGTVTNTVTLAATSWAATALELRSLLPISVPAFRSQAATQGNGTTASIVLNVPTGTLNGDLMIAAIAVRDNTITITDPGGWNLIRETNDTLSITNRLRWLWRVASGEPASYTWTFSAATTGSAGGITSFSGTDVSAPIDVETGNFAAATSLTATATGATTTLANEMVVTAHSITDSDFWSPPTGMTKSFDVGSNAQPNSAGMTVVMSYVLQAAAGATGNKSAVESDGGGADSWSANLLAIKAAPLPDSIYTAVYTPISQWWDQSRTY